MENTGGITPFGKFSYLDYLKEKSFVNGLIMANAYQGFHKIDGNKLTLIKYIHTAMTNMHVCTHNTHGYIVINLKA